MTFTNDQYYALMRLEKWYRKYNHQTIEISGVIGTGIWQLLQYFFERIGIDTKEIMYLSYDQKQVLELAYKRYHAYYVDGIIYKYTRHVDFNSLPVISNNRNSLIKYEWKKDVRKKIDSRYRIMVVFDSMLMNENTLKDLSSFGLPIILIRDPMLLPAPDSYTFFREPNISLREIHPDLIKNPIVYFAYKILSQEKLKYGNYDNVTILPRKQMNLYNLKSADMVITLSDTLMDQTNKVYRDRILNYKTPTNHIGEKVIVMSDMYGHRLVNKDEKKVKVYLTRGLVGYLNKCNKHVLTTKYVPIEFRPEFYHESFEDLVMDRHYLNDMNLDSKQIIPDEIIKLKYAYALSVPYARLSHWDKVTLIVDSDEEQDEELQTRLLYTAISKARKTLNIII